MPYPPLHNCTIGIIGLGYVGLPLAIEFAVPRQCEHTNTLLDRRVIGFDINDSRLSELKTGFDRTNEASREEIKQAVNLTLTCDCQDLAYADVFIVTVPTPIDNAKRPNLNPLKQASRTVGCALKARQEMGRDSMPIVIYESTVYPGATEEICVPILEEVSGLVYIQQFACGYSPERINPGDKHHTLTNIKKVTSGSTQDSSTWIDQLYGSIIKAGTHRASSIAVAEAAKVIENTQRDLNIALINELAIIFNKLNIDTLDVLDAASSKWNFLPFRPGLVGGHCIGVDPYYLTHKAEQVGYHPEVVLAGRRINDRMGEWIAEQVVKKMAREKIPIGGSRVLILGITFKENCPDLRNTKVVDIINTLSNYSIQSIVVDPLASKHDALREYGVTLNDSSLETIDCEAIIVAVAHDQFKYLSFEKWNELSRGKIIFDVKGIVPLDLKPSRL